MPSSNKGKYSFKVLITALISLVLITVFVCELLLRAYFFLFPPTNFHLLPSSVSSLHFFEPSEYGGFYSVKSNYHQRFVRHEFQVDVQTNNIGLRENRDYNGETVDIGFIGDSFTFGWGVEAGERFSDVVGNAFPGCSTLSYSYPNGHAPAYYLAYLQSYPELIPKILILGLFAFNDLSSDTEDSIIHVDPENGMIRQVTSKSLKVNENGFIVTKSDVSPRPFSAEWLMRHTAIGRLINVVKHRIQTPNTQYRKPDRIKPLDLGQFDETAITALDYIKQIDRLAKENQSLLVIFYIPFASDIGESPICQYSENSCNKIRTENALGSALASWARENSIHFIDPVSQFRSLEKQGETLYFSEDGHWTKAGHSATGALIVEYLKTIVLKSDPGHVSASGSILQENLSCED